MHEASVPPPQRHIHPFAYNTGQTIPFSALASSPEIAGEMEYIAHQSRPRPESDVLSRGAGMRSLARPQDAVPGGHVGPMGMDTPQSGASFGMGTFGMGLSQDRLNEVGPSPLIGYSQLTRSKAVPQVPPKATPPLNTIPRKAPPEIQPTTPRARSAAASGRAGHEHAHAEPHVHHPHHDHPFSLAEAARKQAEAIAHIQTMAQLTQGHPSPGGGGGGGPKGPRKTYETTTSGPSFGHILHQDGMPTPVPGQVPTQPDGYPPTGHGPIVGGQGNIARELAGLRGSEFFRLPFGPTVSMSRLTGPFSVGLGYGGDMPGFSGFLGQKDLSRVAESPEGVQRRDDRSAYVETVQDVSIIVCD